MGNKLTTKAINIEHGHSYWSTPSNTPKENLLLLFEYGLNFEELQNLYNEDDDLYAQIQSFGLTLSSNDELEEIIFNLSSDKAITLWEALN